MRIPTVTHNALAPRERKGRDGKRASYIGKTSELLDAEAKIEAYLSCATPERPLEGPLAMELAYVFYDETAPEDRLTYKTTKPDWDNLAKTTQDAMGRLGWFAVGDQQVCSAGVSKYRSPNSEGIRLAVWEIDEEALS